MRNLLSRRETPEESPHVRLEAVWYVEADWTYSVTARPKEERTIVPTPTPQPTAPPDEPHLPQTGLLLWPVLALAAAGLALFVCGWIVFFSRKRHG